MGRTSIELDFEVHKKSDPETLVATGQYVLVSVKQGEFAPAPIPDRLRMNIARFVEPRAER